MNPAVDISNKPSPHSTRNKLARLLWNLTQATIFRLIPRPLHSVRARILRLFGARVSLKARVCPRVRIWGPWNLTMGDYATLADDVDCYCVAPISIGAHTTISQYTYLCAATHDYQHKNFPLQPKPITIGPHCWIAADCFVGPGLTIGQGTVVGARSSVFTDLPPWKVCVGSPAKPVKDRIIKEG
ncbi:MAG: WcaF family extracellular polysaccharide biosynthesis acetyltransferase [Phycisphaeraceae bacterium]|nr:WcaF family extracellular polysaccharide biosynthesis acetyltransferase [Phycisphaeraceae bacterium]MCW5762140.1 WcaF family extracellular polysaccharide biosynthesis acetyltransferase [Phycisphaeraceae bacterium]